MMPGYEKKFGRIVAIGYNPVNYDDEGRITSIAWKPVFYDSNGYIERIDCNPVNYENGCIISIGVNPVHYDYEGRIESIGMNPVTHDTSYQSESKSKKSNNFTNSSLDQHGYQKPLVTAKLLTDHSPLLAKTLSQKHKNKLPITNKTTVTDSHAAFKSNCCIIL